MKKYISLTLGLILSMNMLVPTFAETTVVNAKVLYTNTNTPISFKKEVLNVDGTTFFPLRELLNNLGVANEDINWEATTKTVTFSNDNYTSSFTIGKNEYTSNGVIFDMPVAPFIKDGNTYLPIRYVANSLGIKVGYDEGIRQILLTKPSYSTPMVYTSNDLPQLQPVNSGEYLATLHTNYGDITMRFFPEYAPLAVENFLTLASEDYYDGVTFHRVINDFVIQGGDPTGTGSGGESIYGGDFENEVTTYLRHFTGAVAMANAGPDTNGSQFYIVENDKLDDNVAKEVTEFRNNPYELLDTVDFDFYLSEFLSPIVADTYLKNGGLPTLDSQYTVFGQVIEGMDVVHKIAEVQTNNADKPLEDVIINDIEITQAK